MKQTTLATTLRSLIEARHLTIEAVADGAGVKRGTVGGWLGGVSPRRLEDAKRVAEFLGVSFHFLCFGSEEADPLRVLRNAQATIVLDGLFRLKLERIDAKEIDRA